MCHWNFLLTSSFQPHCGPGIDSASKRNEYQEYFLGGKGGWCVGLTTLPPSFANCLEIWEPQTPGTLRACTGITLLYYTLLYLLYFALLHDFRKGMSDDIDAFRLRDVHQKMHDI